MLLPVRNLQLWIEQNVLLFLKDAPFERRDAHLFAIAGRCVDCPKRTGHNKLLFSELQAGRLHRPKLLSSEGADQHGVRQARGGK
jgi:hypothetical protein